MDQGYPKQTTGWGLNSDHAKEIAAMGTDSIYPNKSYFFLNTGEYMPHDDQQGGQYNPKPIDTN